MAHTHLRSVEEIRKEQLRQAPAFRAYWERTALARAVALAVIGYRVEHQLTQTKLAQKLGMRQPQVARLEMGEHTPSLEMLRRLAQVLGLRFVVAVAPAGEGAPESALTLPPGMEVVEDVTADGSRLVVATG
jgi:ribosome-binding protein aMBF1 (putative translation factor)